MANSVGDALYAYPSDLPVHAAEVLANFVRGFPEPKGHVAHAAWEVVGYGLSVGWPDTVMAEGTALTGAELLARLDEIKVLKADAKGFPWLLVMQAVWMILQQLLKDKETLP